MIVKRGDIYYADLSPVVGSEQGGIRPVLVIQNDIGNKYSPTVIAAAITSQINKAKMPTHIELAAKDYGLNKDSVILLEQIRTIDKRRLREKIGQREEYRRPPGDGSAAAVWRPGKCLWCWAFALWARFLRAKYQAIRRVCNPFCLFRTCCYFLY